MVPSSVIAAEPLVSVVLPTRDRVQFLRGAVASVLAQSEQDLELLVIDDASTDGTVAYLADLARSDRRVRVIRNSEAQGGARARNEGIRCARGAWVAFLDDDDEWMPNKLERQLETLTADGTAVACSCGYVKQVGRVWSTPVRVPSRVSVHELLVRNRLGGASMCVCSGKILKEIGGFDAKLRSAQDHDLWLRLRQRGEIVSCSEPLVLLRVHRGVRISNDMQSQYQGARRFYFKHRSLMDADSRRCRLAYNCFVMSRQTSRSLRYRYRHLVLSVHSSSPVFSLSYARSSAPRLAKDALCKPLTFLLR
jgi:glycosyltransferase involved in cell wall biosynthesis